MISDRVPVEELAGFHKYSVKRTAFFSLAHESRGRFHEDHPRPLQILKVYYLEPNSLKSKSIEVTRSYNKEPSHIIPFLLACV